MFTGTFFNTSLEGKTMTKKALFYNTVQLTNNSPPLAVLLIDGIILQQAASCIYQYIKWKSKHWSNIWDSRSFDELIHICITSEWGIFSKWILLVLDNLHKATQAEMSSDFMNFNQFLMSFIVIWVFCCPLCRYIVFNEDIV